MEKGSWRKAPPELIEVFESVFPGPPAVARQMFGYPAGFVNGNMFMGLLQEEMNLRLGPADRSELLAMEGASVFEPMPGRPMAEYVKVPPSLLANADELEAWVAKALAYGASLPLKAAKAKGAAKARARPTPSRDTGR